MTAVRSALGPATRGAGRPGRALPVALWLAAAVISGFTARRMLEPFDEGVMLQAAARMAGGQWPWRDFGWAYGPGQPLVLAAAERALGVSVLWWRLLRVAVDATTALLVWALARERAGPRWAAVAWAAAAVTAAQPVSANPTPTALALGLASVLLAARGRAGWAGAAAGAAMLWRPDLGVCAAVAALLAARPAQRNAGRDITGTAAIAGGRRAAARVTAAAAAAGVAALLFAPFVAVAGVPRVWRALVVQARADAAWWRLPFPDGYRGRLSPRPEDVKDVLAWVLPYAALAGSAVAVALLLARRERTGAALGVLALGAVGYLLSRADEFHAQPLLLVATALLPLAAAASAAGRERPRPASRGAGPRAAGGVTATVGNGAGLVLAAVLALILAVGAANRLSALVRPPRLEPVGLAVAPGIRVPPAEARALPALVRRIQRLVPPGKPVYVAPRRSDLVTSADPLLHVLTGRPNVLHRDALLQAKPAEQARIVAALRAARPRAVIRWLDPASSHPEANARGRPSGSRALDAYLAGAYRPLARYGAYLVLVPR